MLVLVWVGGGEGLGVCVSEALVKGAGEGRVGLGRTVVVVGVWVGIEAVGEGVGLVYVVVGILRVWVGNSTCGFKLILVGVAAHRRSVIMLVNSNSA